MSMNRRSALKRLVVLGTAAAAPAPAVARTRRSAPAEAMALLYDATRCIGCQTCMVACREANKLRYESWTSLYDAPKDLSANTKTVVKLYRRNGTVNYIKSQCMHCIDPACTSVCMLGALYKRADSGVVAYDPDKCVGCRYCQVACPFNVPKFEWASATPKIVKCELCRHLTDQGGNPACAQVCPRKAIVFGKREELLAEAKGRMAANPAGYISKVYGEVDGGGTQVLFISAATFEELGLPSLGEEAIPELSETIQHGVYQGFIVPAALYGLLGLVMLRNRRQSASGEKEEVPS